MNKVPLKPYKNLTNDQLIEFTIEEMDRLKNLREIEDFDEYEKEVLIVNELIIEIKRRDLSIKKHQLIKRIFNK